MDIIAKYKQVRSSAQKIRLIANFIRGKKVLDVMNILTYHKKKAAGLVKKVLTSVIANAEHNYGIEVEKLFVKKIFVDSGTTMKRMMPRAKGRSDKILKRTSHITVIVSNK